MLANFILISMIIVGILYFVIALCYALKGNIGMAAAFFCYAIANFGLYFAS